MKFLRLNHEKFCINRNIVECKVCINSCNICKFCCINRNIVECKDGICTYQIRSRSVLIETLWNVK
mgnify:CR=1 FL=1